MTVVRGNGVWGVNKLKFQMNVRVQRESEMNDDESI